MDVINPVTVALLFNPFGDVDVVICPCVNLVKRNWLKRTHIMGPSLHWFVMQAATPCGHVIQDGRGVNMVCGAFFAEILYLHETAPFSLKCIGGFHSRCFGVAAALEAKVRYSKCT